MSKEVDMTNEELITGLKHIAHTMERNGHSYYHHVAEDAIKALEQQQRWIPCSERLPEEDGQYLITVKYKPEADYENIYAEHGEWTDGRWDMFCFGHCGEVEDIIAWMPLPEPYKEDEE